MICIFLWNLKNETFTGQWIFEDTVHIVNFKTLHIVYTTLDSVNILKPQTPSDFEYISLSSINF